MLSETIRRLLADETYETGKIGMSGSQVLLFEDKVLKIQDDNDEAENEYRMMSYLSGRLPVPGIYSYEKENGKTYLLMGRCEGRMACHDVYMRDPALQCRLLANGLKKLWSVDISRCPCDQRLSHKLIQARYNVESNLVDLDNVEPSTFGEKGFRDPAALLQWLFDNIPQQEPVLSHGDYCLPNLFGDGDQVTGYIDLGKTGIADKWCDIALCYRSLSHNHSGKYNADYRRDKDSRPDDLLLFRELGIEPDWEKINYYILLDELF